MASVTTGILLITQPGSSSSEGKEKQPAWCRRGNYSVHERAEDQLS